MIKLFIIDNCWQSPGWGGSFVVTRNVQDGCRAASRSFRETPRGPLKNHHLELEIPFSLFSLKHTQKVNNLFLFQFFDQTKKN